MQSVTSILYGALSKFLSSYASCFLKKNIYLENNLNCRVLTMHMKTKLTTTTNLFKKYEH